MDFFAVAGIVHFGLLAIQLQSASSVARTANEEQLVALGVDVDKDELNIGILRRATGITDPDSGQLDNAAWLNVGDLISEGRGMDPITLALRYIQQGGSSGLLDIFGRTKVLSRTEGIAQLLSSPRLAAAVSAELAKALS